MSSTQQLLLAEGGGGAAPNYIEDVFSTYLYTGNSSTQTITNNIDLSTKGGLVWIRNRTLPTNNILTDSARGTAYFLSSNLTNAQDTNTPNLISGFNTTGFGLGASSSTVNASGSNYASWTFRKQPKFFDVVTYTGTGSNTTIAHNLGSVPGCIMVKRTDTTGAWQVYHRSLANTEYMVLNTTAATATGATRWNSTTPTSTVFSLGTDATVNASGGTYVAYVFAHDAGGFGLTGTDNVISCGSFTVPAGGSGSNAVQVNLGYEPQWLMTKRINTSGDDWSIYDVMTGFSYTYANRNNINQASEETVIAGDYLEPTATGFQSGTTAGIFSGGDTYIYIAIRRGPMKVPTDATKVFLPQIATSPTGTVKTTNFPVDFQIEWIRNGDTPWWVDRLRGVNSPDYTNTTRFLSSANTLAENNSTTGKTYRWNNTGFSIASDLNNANAVFWSFQRAPSFFDEVCYTGDGTYPAARAIPHNLTVAPEIIIYKCRSAAVDWEVDLNISTLSTKRLYLNSDGAGAGTSLPYGGYAAAPTATNIYVRDAGGNVVNGSGQTYVAYLFATCAGVSKVGSYTGTGATQTISCGFAGGARFVLVKRTDTTGDWYVWDTARGMVSGTDPSLRLNSAAAEVNANSIYTTTGGFQIVSTAAGINASGGTYIYLAIA